MRYKTQLEALALKAAQNNNLTACSDEIMSVYMPSSPTGEMIYESFSDDELKAMLTTLHEELGRCPTQKEIYCIYKAYIRLRFGNWPWALQAAGLRPSKEHTKKRKRRRRYFQKKTNGGNSDAKNN